MNKRQRKKQDNKKFLRLIKIIEETDKNQYMKYFSQFSLKTATGEHLERLMLLFGVTDNE